MIKRVIDHIKGCIKKRNLKLDEITYFLPHMSSMFFYPVLEEGLKRGNVYIPTDKWFFNLPKVGNIGSVSIFIALEELINTRKLEKGNKILLHVPESGRFGNGLCLLTVV